MAKPANRQNKPAAFKRILPPNTLRNNWTAMIDVALVAEEERHTSRFDCGVRNGRGHYFPDGGRIVVLADVFEKLLAGIPAEAEGAGGPGRCVRAGIVGGDFILHIVVSCAREALDEVKFIGMRCPPVHPKPFIETDSVHGQRIPFP